MLGTGTSHIHVERDDCHAKFWLAPARYDRSKGFGRKELRKIADIIEKNELALVESWNEFFSD
jgi:Domain of unknown function (DUF4160)